MIDSTIDYKIKSLCCVLHACYLSIMLYWKLDTTDGGDMLDTLEYNTGRVNKLINTC